MRFTVTQLAIGAFAVWFFFIRKSTFTNRMVAGGKSAGYMSIVDGEGYP